MIEVHLATPLRPLMRGARVVNAEGKDLRELVNNLEADYPGFKERVLEPDGSMRPFVNIFVNDEDAGFLKGLETQLKDGDVVSILPAVSGGSERPALEIQ
jgi:molybdopterin synthase sulfur carrier subunit